MWWIFPPKNLEKYGVQNTHAPIFFFLKYIYCQQTENLVIRFLLVLSSTISKQVNKVKYSVSVSTFIVLQYTLNKSQKFYTQQIILFVLSNFQLNQKRC